MKVDYFFDWHFKSKTCKNFDLFSKGFISTIFSKLDHVIIATSTLSKSYKNVLNSVGTLIGWWRSPNATDINKKIKKLNFRN